MAESTSLPIPRTTSPLYGAQAGELAGQLATLSTEELAKILRVNHRIAATNRAPLQPFPRRCGEGAAGAGGLHGHRVQTDRSG